MTLTLTTSNLASTAVPTSSPRRLRIAYVVHDYNRRYGHSRYVAELATRFKRDHEVHVFANTFEEPDADGLTYHHVPAWRHNVMTTLLTFLAPSTWMVRGGFDIIHAQGVCGFKHNVVTAHICQEAWREAMGRYAGIPNWRKRLFHALACRLERWIFRDGGAARFIAVSDRIREDIEAHYGCTSGVRVVHHGVDTERFHPRLRTTWRPLIREQLGISDATPLALYVGDLQKALPAAVLGVARVPGLHLATVSRSPTEPYKGLIAELGVANRVHLLPASDRVERYYAAADLFLFPTFYDSFGLVVTEAMASGLPVVCSRAAGAAELIADGENGVLVDNGWDPNCLAPALRRLESDADLRRAIGLRARSTIADHSWNSVATRTLEIYREVVAA